MLFWGKLLIWSCYTSSLISVSLSVQETGGWHTQIITVASATPSTNAKRIVKRVDKAA
jgi:hypothetical protein